MATIKDVARMAGVSTATVSNYLNHTKPVSPEVSLKIQQAVDELQYNLNLSAKSLKSNSYTDIGVILPNFDDSYYVQLFQGIENAFQNTGYYTNLAFSYDLPEQEQNIIRNFLKKQIRGLLLVSCQPDNWKFFYNHFTSDKRPLVLIDRDIHSLDANFISFDHYSFIKQSTDQLLSMQHRRICLITGPKTFTSEARSMKGFTDSLQEAGLEPESSFIINTNQSKEDAFRKAVQFLRIVVPDAFITTSESLAAGVIEALAILGLSPREIPVITLGEEHWNLFTHSFASGSAARPAMKLGHTAADLLLAQLRSPLTKENERIILKNDTGNVSSSFREIPVIPSISVSSHPSKRVRILMMDTPQVHTLLGVLKNFEKRTNIKADVTILPHHDLYETILQKHYAEDEIPYDVFMYDIPWLPSLASAHILSDITEELKAINLNIFFPGCLNYFSTFENRYYGLPFMYAPQILYYRKDLFENQKLQAEYKRQNSITLRPPLTLKEFNTIADFFTNHTDAVPYGISIPGAYAECLVPEIYMRLHAYGGKLFDSRGNVCLERTPSLKAYINLLRSVRLAKPDYLTATDTSVVQDFLNGETAMLITYPAFMTDVVDLRKNSINGVIGYHHIPGRSPLLGGWSLGISNRSPQKAEAFAFLKWICDEQTANYFTLLGGQSAITSTYTNDELNKHYPWLPLYHSTYSYTEPIMPPRLKNNLIPPQNQIDSIVFKWFCKLLEGELEVQDAITSTQQDLEAFIQNFPSLQTR